MPRASAFRSNPEWRRRSAASSMTACRRRERSTTLRDPAPARRARGGGVDLAGERAGKSLFVNRGMPDMAVEIAIRAFRQAERPVHVNAEGVLFALSRLRGRVGGGVLSAGQGRSPPA